MNGDVIKLVFPTGLDHMFEFINSGFAGPMARLRRSQVNAPINGSTYLHFVADAGALKLARFLVHADANVNSTNRDGKTVLYCAVGSENTKLVAYLLSEGAEVTGDARDLLNSKPGGKYMRAILAPRLRHTEHVYEVLKANGHIVRYAVHGHLISRPPSVGDIILDAALAVICYNGPKNDEIARFIESHSELFSAHLKVYELCGIVSAYSFKFI